jgi:hypothetical protein
MSEKASTWRTSRYTGHPRGRLTPVPSLLLLSLIILVGKGDSQTNTNAEFHDTKVILTGIVIVNDWRCEERRAERSLPEMLQMVCPEGGSDWGLVTGPTMYLLKGDATNFKKHERARVTISGLATGRKIAVDSIVPARITDREIFDLIEELRSHRWSGPENRTNPTHWIFSFTDPMLKILQAGSSAQDILVQYLDDREIKDQIIILLGGVGDERVVGSIIQGMPTPAETYWSADAKKINLIANLALTNITVSETIWHHGGGITVDACPQDPKYCWHSWWAQNKDTFRVAAGTANRRYSNYPNYGIYQQP